MQDIGSGKLDYRILSNSAAFQTVGTSRVDKLVAVTDCRDSNRSPAAQGFVGESPAGAGEKEEDRQQPNGTSVEVYYVNDRGNLRFPS